MRFKIVTSLSKPLWDKYAKECIGTWLNNFDLPEGSVFEFWVQGPFPSGLPTYGGGKNGKSHAIRWKSLDTQSEGWKDFIQQWGNHPIPEVEEGHKYRFNFQPFSCKVFALAEAAWAIQEKNENFDVLVWIDADVKATQRIDEAWLLKTLGNSNVSFLDRGEPWGYGETGYIAAKINPHTDLREGEVNPVIDIFIEQAKIYGSGQLFFFREWHDAFVFTSVLRRFNNTDERIEVVNLNQDMKSEHKGGLQPFETSILSERLVHLKGNRKDDVNK